MVRTAVSGALGESFIQLNGPIEHATMDDPGLMEAWVAAATAWCDEPRNKEQIEVVAALLLSA